MTEIVSYGVIYYAFPVLATQITVATGWSRTAVTLAYPAGSLAGALAGVPAGRLIQCHGPRPVMTAGSVLGALAVAGAPDYGLFVAAWLAAGLASAGLYYPPAFAALTTWYGPRRVAALTTLTLAATVPAHALFLRLPWTPPPARARPSSRAARTAACWPAGRS